MGGPSVLGRLQRGGFGVEQIDFAGEFHQRRLAFREIALGGIGLDLLQDGRGGARSYIGASSLGIVRQMHAPGGVLFADGGIQQHHLASGIIDQRRQDLAHQQIIIERHLAQLVTIEDGSVLSEFHTSIVACAGELGNQRNRLDQPKKTISPVPAYTAIHINCRETLVRA